MKIKNISNIYIGENSIKNIPEIKKKFNKKGGHFIFFIDNFFKDNEVALDYKFTNDDHIIFIPTNHEPTTDQIDQYIKNLKTEKLSNPKAIFAIGGGITMDVAKAVSNMLTNPGSSKNYQGWDLLQNPGIYKVGIPTISGTGAESTRTCVLLDKSRHMKLGMNSEFSMFNEVILDPQLTKSVPKNQYFYTAMDTYIHSLESLDGNYRNTFADIYSNESINICRNIFSSEDFMSLNNRENLMIASYYGGCGIALSFLGLIHPMSAALSVVFSSHHCISNCMVMYAMEKIYPKYFQEFFSFVDKHKIEIPRGICKNLSHDEEKSLIKATLIHEKPLKNAFGDNFKSKLTEEYLLDLFKKI